MAKETSENLIKSLQELDGSEEQHEGTYFQEEIDR
jgi:hypothetical protein